MKRWKPALIGTTLLTAAAYCLAQAAPAGYSPVKDMPADWFFYGNAEEAAPQAALIGKPAPRIETSRWFQGEVKPDAMKGKIVVLDLWATWCGPCKAAMPHGEALYEKYKDRGVVYLAVCSDGDQAFVPPFIAEKKLSFPMAWDRGTTTFDAFRGQFYPTYVAIDRKGIVRAIGLTPDGVEKVVEQLLAEK